MSTENPRFEPVSPGWQPSFEGLTLKTTPGDGALTSAALATLQQLDELGALKQYHALQMQLILSLARAVDAGLAYGRISVATSNMAKQLGEALKDLPMPETINDAFNAFMAGHAELLGA